MVVRPRVNSASNTVAKPTARAASAKRTMPYMPSWSVTASASSPSRAASSASSSGWLAPSRKEKLVWQCSSAYPMGIATLSNRCSIHNPAYDRSMLLSGVNHVAVLTQDTDRFHAFYRDVFDATVFADQTIGDG